MYNAQSRGGSGEDAGLAPGSLWPTRPELGGDAISCAKTRPGVEMRQSNAQSRGVSGEDAGIATVPKLVGDDISRPLPGSKKPNDHIAKLSLIELHKNRAKLFWIELRSREEWRRST